MQKTEIGLYKRRAAPSRPEPSYWQFRPLTRPPAHLTTRWQLGYSSYLARDGKACKVSIELSQARKNKSYDADRPEVWSYCCSNDYRMGATTLRREEAQRNRISASRARPARHGGYLQRNCNQRRARCPEARRKRGGRSGRGCSCSGRNASERGQSGRRRFYADSHGGRAGGRHRLPGNRSSESIARHVSWSGRKAGAEAFDGRLPGLGSAGHRKRTFAGSIEIRQDQLGRCN